MLTLSHYKNFNMSTPPPPTVVAVFDQMFEFPVHRIAPYYDYLNSNLKMCVCLSVCLYVCVCVCNFRAA